MRRYIIFAISLVLLFGSITTVIATKNIQNYDLRGYADATQTTDLPYRIPRLGVNADLFQYDADELSQHLEWMQDANINWIRQFIYWDTFEPEQGAYQWQDLNAIMVALEAYPQMQLIPVFMNSPAWARDSEILTAPPTDPQSIRPFLQAFAERYGEAIDYYQIWDEPNLDDAWGLENPRPAEYTALLSESYRAIHGADAYATVILAGLAPTSERAGQNIADTLYLQMLYDLEADAYFDAVASKPYGFDTAPNDRDVSIDSLNFSRIILLREVMLSNDDGQTALWASNWGWNSLPIDWTGSESIWGDVTADEQVRFTLDALNRAEREWAWLGGMVLQHWQPNVDTDDPQWGFAVIGQDNQPSALFNALANYNLPYATNGLYHPRTEFAQYSGLWTFNELGADIGWLETSDSQLDFEFYGTDVSLLLREDDYIAFLYPALDNELVNATPLDADGRPYILMRSGSHHPEINLVPVSRNLSEDIHNLHVIADRGEDRWALAGYAVSSGNLAQPYERQIQIAWLTTFIAFLTMLVSAYYLPWKQIYSRAKQITSRIDDGIQFVITVVTSIALMIGLLMSVGVPEPSLFRREMVEQGLLIIITGGLLIIKLPLLVSIIAVLVLFWLIYHHIEWGLLLTLFYAPFFLFPVELYTFFFPMSELLILITTGAWLLKLFVQWGVERQSANSDYPLRLTIQWHCLDILMLLWLGLAILAVTWSADTASAITELRTFFIEPFLFYAIFRSSKLEQATIEKVMLGLVSAGVVVSLIGLYQYFIGDNVITAENGTARLLSVYGSPNNVGLLLGRLIPFALSGVLLLGGLKRLLAFAILLLFLVAVALTQSVGAILFGVPIGIAVVCIAIYGKRSLPILAILGIIGIIATFGLIQVSARFASLLDLSSGTNFIRIRVWESSLEILQDNPITGLGLDQFLPTFSGEYIRPDAIADPDLSHPHNIVLDFWIRLGLLGVFWLITFMGIFWRSIYYALKNTQDSNRKVMIIGVMGAMASLTLHGMIDNSVYVNDLSMIFAFLVAITATYANKQTESQQGHPQ
ncbi:MAG: O-antigen ligase family protein [Phototrophicaceae bacterium]